MEPLTGSLLIAVTLAVGQLQGLSRDFSQLDLSGDRIPAVGAPMSTEANHPLTKTKSI